MKIASAASLLQPAVQAELNKSLGLGRTLPIPTATEQEEAEIKAHLGSPSAGLVINNLVLNHSDTTVLVIEPAVYQVLESGIPVGQFTPEQKVLIGMGTGAMVGSGAALLLQTLGTVSPKSALAFTFASALIGSGIGGAKAAGVLPSIGYDPKSGKITIS